MDTLLDKYIEEIGQHLPKKMRADIQAEIRSLLEDTLDDRSAAYEREVDEAMMVEVLKEHGSPEKVAASYLPEKYLIGPQLYPIFMLVMRIVLIVVAVISLIGLGAKLDNVAMGQVGVGSLLSEAVIEFMGSMLQVLGNVVLIFAFLQWTLPELPVREKDWDPLRLKGAEEHRLVKRWGLLLEIAITLGVILVFNFYPQLIGIGYASDGIWTFRSILTRTFFDYLPWLNGVWILTIVLNMVLIRRGRWQLVTRILDLVKDVWVLVILFAMKNGPIIADVPQIAVTAVLWVIIVGIGIAMVEKLYRMIFGKRRIEDVLQEAGIGES